MNSYYKVIGILSFLLISILNVNAQEEKKKRIMTSEFEVTGVCKMCKERIEEAALIKGVKYATWDKNAQKLKVIYKTKKVTLLEIQKAVAKAGHDTEKVKATEEDYEKLPDCCAYRDGVEVH